MNLIDRDKLIEEYALDSDTGILGMLRYRPQAVIDRINAQPTVSEWIPIERELPKSNELYNVVIRNINENTTFRSSAYFSGGTGFNEWQWSTGIDIEKIIGKDDLPEIEVIAWMTIPEYKGDNND